jgi:hypothetical protein
MRYNLTNTLLLRQALVFNVINPPVVLAIKKPRNAAKLMRGLKATKHRDELIASHS